MFPHNQWDIHGEKLCLRKLLTPLLWQCQSTQRDCSGRMHSALMPSTVDEVEQGKKKD